MIIHNEAEYIGCVVKHKQLRNSSKVDAICSDEA